MFGKRMFVGSEIILQPFTPSQIEPLVEKMWDHEITKYINMQHSPTPEQELEWVEKMAKNPDSTAWGIFLAGSPTVLRGITSVHMIDPQGNRRFAGVVRGGTGISIYDKEMWGKKLTKQYIHPARMWYIAQHLNIPIIESAVVEPNYPSLKTLESVGYVVTGKDYCIKFTDGQYHNHWNLQWFNPNYTQMLFPNGIPDNLVAPIQRAEATIERIRPLIKYG